MRSMGLAMLAAAMLAGTPALAQISETEHYEGGANELQRQQREVIQRNIDVVTQALRAKDYVKARKYALPVTRADPKRIEAWLLLGTAQLGLEDWKKARTTYTTALRLAPNHPEARAGLGVAYAHTNDPKAQVQLAWLENKIAECGGCWQAGQLAKFRSDVRAAIATAQPAVAAEQP